MYQDEFSVSCYWKIGYLPIAYNKEEEEFLMSRLDENGKQYLLI